MTALTINLWICLGVTFLCWLASVITREYSWVDRIWSIIPIVYAWVFAVHAADARVTLVAVLITAWGIRLTFNFARRGGYAPGGEDYRWAILRERLPGWRFQLFNIGFIATYQNAILLLIVLPLWTMSAHPGAVGLTEWALAAVFVAFLAGETIADQQRWAFHQRGSGGVLETGLYRYSRHPNYFFEIAQWWVVFAFAVAAAGTVVLPTIAGAVLLTLLFIGSTIFTESISLKRRPEYAGYRRTTSMIVPWPRRSATSTESAP